MGLAISPEHQELAATVRRWAEARALLTAARASLEVDLHERGETWREMGDHGWLGLAVGESHGGQGFGVGDAAIVCEELGRWCAPGPALPTMIAAVALDRWGTDRRDLRALATGRSVGGLSLAWGLAARPQGDGLRIAGRLHAVWSGADADVVVAPVEVRGVRRWVVLETAELGLRGLDSFDATRRLAEAQIDGLDVDSRHVLAEHADVMAVATVLAGAEAVGIAQWCVDTAAAYAAVREQFGRPIGQFQAVKHRCADMLVRTEAARAAVWDAARALDDVGADVGSRGPGDEPVEGAELSVAVAAAVAFEAAFQCAKDVIQVLGGVGYTWEHDAHLFLKRATALRYLVGSPSDARDRVVAAVVAGERRPVAVELPPEAEPLRDHVRRFIIELKSRPSTEWNDAIIDSGYLVPHWPAPYGRDAGPIEQLVIDEGFAEAGLRRRHLQVAGWVLPTIINHGSDEQKQRWVMPSLRGELMWCQMFSEPGAGSDLASLMTRATKVDGGWSITGQKVWTTMAHVAQWAICLARTDPAVPKHEGIGCFMIDMTTPGLDIRPLRELTGMALFNEVFLTDVFVPDDCLVGGPTEGWSAARTTLANERVSMASGSSFGPGVASVIELAQRQGVIDDPLVRDRLGRLVVDAHTVAMLGVRTTLRALGGGQPGPEASVRKLIGVTHEQEVQEVGLELLGPDAVVNEGEGAAWTAGFLGNRALSIAGGTSEIQRNVIAERLLGLPKDP